MSSDNLDDFKGSLKEILSLHSKLEDIEAELESVGMDLEGHFDELSDEEKEQARELLKAANLGGCFVSETW